MHGFGIKLVNAKKVDMLLNNKTNKQTRNVEYSSIVITPRFTQHVVVVHVTVPSMSQIELFKNVHIWLDSAQKTLFTIKYKIWEYEWTMYETSRHKIKQCGLTCRKNQSILNSFKLSRRHLFELIIVTITMKNKQQIHAIPLSGRMALKLHNRRKKRTEQW